MGLNLTQKIIQRALVSGRPVAGERISLRVDQVLTQDATGTMAYLQFAALGVPRIRVPLAVSYVDHNTLQTNYYNPDDHLFLRTAAAKYGAYFSKPGNGICHQVHLERFAVPGKVLLGSDSHTPTCGGMGMLAIGTGGLDIAAVMAGSPYELIMPRVRLVHLTGRLSKPWVAAMDVILEILRRLSVKGGAGWVMEYGGPGVATLSVTERATITNMGAELGATTSVFPSDGNTRHFLRAQGREADWVELAADADAEYDDVLELDLSRLEPLIARPHSPDNVVPIQEAAGRAVQQVCIGSCTNSSLQVLKNVAAILKGRSIAQDVSFTVNPGSKQVYAMLARDGDLFHIISAGARLLEASCGPCIGMGQAPGTGAVSIRSFNRNFKGRCATQTAEVYLCNPLAATVMALEGRIVDPRMTGIEFEPVEEPEAFLVNDNMILPPAEEPDKVEIVMGPNIKAVPVGEPLEAEFSCPVVLRLGDDITTDDIMPAGSNILPLRSNIPAIADFVFSNLDPTFPSRAKAAGRAAIVAGENYGQGSSREHAALAPMYLGLRVVIAKSFARIHKNNLVNFGILPLEFAAAADYEGIEQGDELYLSGLREAVLGAERLRVFNRTKQREFEVSIGLSGRQREIVLAGGLLNYTRQRLGKENG